MNGSHDAFVFQLLASEGLYRLFGPESDFFATLSCGSRSVSLSLCALHLPPCRVIDCVLDAIMISPEKYGLDRHEPILHDIRTYDSDASASLGYRWSKRKSITYEVFLGTSLPPAYLP